MSQIEDLLLRAGTCCPLRLDRSGEQLTLCLAGWHDQRTSQEEARAPLRAAMEGLAQLRWRAEAQTGSFVRSVECDGHDLLLHLASAIQVRAWLEGALLWAWQALLMRLENVTAAGGNANANA